MSVRITGELSSDSHQHFFVSAGHQPALRELGIDVAACFDHPLIKPWRTLPDRENCLLETTLVNGQSLRWHVKRYAAVPGVSPAETEALGIRLLRDRSIPTVELVAYGRMSDGRSALILQDLTGYVAGDKWLAQKRSIDMFVEPVAKLTAQLHSAGLHHRDLYFCHFMLRDNPMDVRLIDAARVAELPGGPRKHRWIIKDLAQLWYSLAEAPEARQRLLDRYMKLMRWSMPRRKLMSVLIRSKSRSIARHDRRLQQRRPERHVSIPR